MNKDNIRKFIGKVFLTSSFIFISCMQCHALVSDYSLDPHGIKQPNTELFRKIKKVIPDIEAATGAIYFDSKIMNGKYLAVSYVTKSDALCESSSFEVGDQISLQRIAVLMDSSDGFKLIDTTGFLESYGPRDHVSYRVHKDTLIIIHRNVGSYVSESNDAWIFKLINNRFQLIGYDGVTIGIEHDKEDNEFYYESGKSINFNTMEIADWRKTGTDTEPWNNKKSWNRAFKVKNTIKNKELRQRISSKKTFQLSGFSFTEWDEWAPNVCGWMNDDFKYRACDEETKHRSITTEWSCGPPYKSYMNTN